MKIKIPKSLSPEAREYWLGLTENLPKGHLQSCDSGTLATYCEALAGLDSAKTQWTAEGRPWTLVHRTGAVGVHPLIQAMKQQSTLIGTLASKLRVCPSARVRVENASTAKHPPEADLGKWEGLLG